MNRREFLVTAGAAASVAAFADEPAKMKTYTYKTVDKLEIQADVYGVPGEKPRPVVIWIHGGALIVGHRTGMDNRLRELAGKAGYIFVSIDYRLAPETRLPAILDDVRDACVWVHEQGPKLFNADPKRIAIAGGSAGGYLTLTSGYRVEPRPKALVAFWGYGDVIADWYSKPDDFYRRQPLVSEEEARKAVGTAPVSGAAGKNQRGRFYLYCRQQGLWPREVVGLDPAKEPKSFDPFCPLRNVKADYPPTLLIHGTKDTDVPYSESANMDKELTQKRIEHELITVKDAGHGLAGAKPEQLTKVYETVSEFLKKHLG
jgi:acetyl esterase/lipase